jgi:hypothetical protein
VTLICIFIDLTNQDVISNILYFQNLATVLMDFHLLKINSFCRFCKELIDIKRTKGCVSNILNLQNPDLGELDFGNEDPKKFPSHMCSSCYAKCKRWKTAYDKHSANMGRRSADKREAFTQNTLSVITQNEISTGLVCSSNQECRVCSHVQPGLEIGPSPSKILRISETASVSPRDKLDPKKRRSDHPPNAGLVSVKIDFQKGRLSASGEVEFQEPETFKIYTETKKSKSYSLEDCQESDQARIFSCKICRRFPSIPVMSSVCGHIFCQACFLNFKSSIQTTICPGIGAADCRKSVSALQIEPLSGLLRNLHSSIHVLCSNSACKKSFPVSQVHNHERSCKRRGSYKHTNALYEARDNYVSQRVGEVYEQIDQFCDERKEDRIEVLFYKLVKDLKVTGNDLYKDVDIVYKKYVKGETESVKVDVLKTVALKSECNLTVGQFRACRKFGLENKVGTNLFHPYWKVLQAEGELDCGNVEFKIIEDGTVIHHHQASPNSSMIDADYDIGSISFEMLNPNIVGNRVSLVSSVCKEIQELYPDLVQLCADKYPDIDLSQRTLSVRTKLAFDGTKSSIKSDKKASRLEVPNWLRGTVCVLSVEILDEFSDLPLFKESNPNSGEANNIVLLWKSDENSFASMALAMSIYDRECAQIDKCVYEVTTKHEVRQNVDVNQNIEEMSVDGNQNNIQPEFVKQKIKIFVDKPKDEKLSRKVHNRAGAGSTYPCTYCFETRTVASNPPFSGRGEITLTNKLEEEVGTYITQNPAKKSQAMVLGISLGQKGIPITTAEPSQEPPDVLHEDINIVDPLFVIGSRIMHFGKETYPEYTYGPNHSAPAQNCCSW